MTSLWRVECKVFGSKFECVWMENEDDNNGAINNPKLLHLYLGPKFK